MPMSRMIELIDSSIGMKWLGMATSPSVAMTADRPSSSGTPAATIVPKARTRISSVIGSESVSAVWRSFSKAPMSSFSELAEPNCATEKSGLSFCTAFVTASVASTRALACLSDPGTSNASCTECLSGEMRALLAALS